MPSYPAAAAIRHATLGAHRAIDALDARTLTDLTRLYQDAAREIRERLRIAAGGDDTLTIAELRGVLDQVNTTLARLRQMRGQLMDDVLRDAVQIGVAPFDHFSTDRLRVTSGVLMRISDDSLRFVRSFVARDGLQLSDRVWRIDRGAKDALVGAIERAIILGQSAEEAARDFFNRGEAAPADLLTKARSATSSAIGRSVEEALTGASYNAQRVFRTEINRAHGEAYMAAGVDHPDFAGWRFLLSPAHPAPDICDLLASQNLYGLGPGVYPTREACPWPAHPNTLSYIEIVFRDEISDADRAGKETSIEALGRLSAEQQRGVLGVEKQRLFERGRITRGMIRAPLRAVQERLRA